MWVSAGDAGSGPGITEYLTTGDPTRFAAQITRLMGDSVDVRRVEIPNPGVSPIRVIEGDITAQDVDVIVNAANAQLAHGGGVAAACAAMVEQATRLATSPAACPQVSLITLN